MNVIVSRDPADRPGTTVVDPLLTSEQAGIARGRREVDHNVAMRSVESGNCPCLPYMETGSLIHVTEAHESYRGKLTLWATTIDFSPDGKDFSVNTAVAIEREVRE